MFRYGATTPNPSTDCPTATLLKLAYITDGGQREGGVVAVGVLVAVEVAVLVAVAVTVPVDVAVEVADRARRRRGRSRRNRPSRGGS